MTSINVDIIESGSTGNSVVYDSIIMVDIGLSWAKLKHHLKGVKIILLTHSHLDHLNLTAIRPILVNYPKIKFGCCEYLKSTLLKFSVPLENIVIFKPNDIINLKGYTIVPFKLYHDHDAPNVGYRIAKGDYRLIHATDTAHLNGVDAIDYDVACIECNYDENMIEDLIAKSLEDGVHTHYSKSRNAHLSVQQAIKFCNDNDIKKIISLHESEKMKKKIKEVLSENNY